MENKLLPSWRSFICTIFSSNSMVESKYRNSRRSGGNFSDPTAHLMYQYVPRFFPHREQKEPYLGLLWEASRSEGSLPHPLLMGPEHLDLLQVLTRRTPLPK